MLQYILGRCLFILLLLLFLIGLMKVFHVLASFSPGDWGSKGAPVLPSVGMDREHRPLPGESTGWERSRDATPKGAKDKRWVEYKAVFQNINRVHCHCCRTMMICTRRASRETQDWTSWSTRLVSYWPVRQDTNQRTGIAIRAILGGIRVMLHACVTNLSKLASLVQDVTIHIQESHLLVMYTHIREIGPLPLSLHCCKHTRTLWSRRRPKRRAVQVVAVLRKVTTAMGLLPHSLSGSVNLKGYFADIRSAARWLEPGPPTLCGAYIAHSADTSQLRGFYICLKRSMSRH